MKVDKLKKLETDIFKMEDVIAESQKRLEVLQQRYKQCRNDRILELVTKAGVSVDEVALILTEYERNKQAKEEEVNEIEYIQREEG